MRFIIIITLILIVLTINLFAERPTEEERVRLWYENGNVWPPNWHEETEQYKEAMRFREQEIMNIPGSDERWENWMQFVQAQLVPTFTTQGFDVIHVPKNVYEKLRDAVLTAVEDWDNIPLEGEVEAIYGDLPPKFVDIGELAWDTIEELKSLHEDWAGGMKLRPTSAYGVRLYQNGSSLAMHNDKIHSHVISSIIHIAHEYDNDDEPWPIQIEDHNGVLHSVALQPGEMLFYESARCLHGRMTELKGKYYGSIFVHYQPVDPRIWSYTVEDVIASVPPHWSENMPDDHGSRWAGQSITTDSRVAAGAPPRIRDSDTQPFQRTNINQKRRAVSVQSPSNA